MNSLSLSQRERIKVRDCFRNAAPARTKSHPELYRVLPGADDSRTAERRFRDWRELSFAPHRALPGQCSYARFHQARSRDEPQGNRNLKRSNQSDVGVGTCGLRTSVFEHDATRSFHNASDSYVGSELESRGGRLSDKFGRRINFRWLAPHLNPLPKLGRGKRSIPKRATSARTSCYLALGVSFLLGKPSLRNRRNLKDAKANSSPFLKGRGLR
jgi:hypothetical protein